MSEMERARLGAISTPDLLARARALANQRTGAASTSESAPSAHQEEEDLEKFDYLQHRRWILTSATEQQAIESLSYQFAPWFEENAEVCDLDEQTLGTYISWAMTDVAWMFVDQVTDDASLELARTFLRAIEQPVPETIGSWVRRAQPDLQKFVALAVENTDVVAFEELSSQAVAMLLGFARAWPADVVDEVPGLVDALLDNLNGWARSPWSISVWEDGEDPWTKLALDTTAKNRVVTKAACLLEQSYASMFFRMADL